MGRGHERSSEADHETGARRARAGFWRVPPAKKILDRSFSTGFARAVHSFSTGGCPVVRLPGSRRYNGCVFKVMRVLSRLVFLLSVACASAASAADATLFRIFLRDGAVLVSYGEFSRVEDRVIFSMPVGGGADEPRLQVVWVAADAVDWPRTERYANSARFQQYAQTRGEEDFRALNDDVARVLNEIAVTTDRARAMELASRARAALATWP